MGTCKDYVKSMWKILQTKKPEDFVIAKKIFSQKDFVNLCSKKLDIHLIWKGKVLMSCDR